MSQYRIINKYITQCRECKEYIEVGNECYYNPKLDSFLKITCLDCGQEEGQQPFEARKNYDCPLCNAPISQGDSCFYASWLEGTQKIICMVCLEKRKIRKSSVEYSIPQKDCSNDNCDNKCLAKYYFCTSCYSKLPHNLKQTVGLAYDWFLKDKKNNLGALTKAHRECLQYL